MKKQDLKKLIDSYFHNTIQVQQIENAIKGLADRKHITDIEEVMKNHWMDPRVIKEMPDEKEFTQLLDRIHHRININKGKERQTYKKTISIIAQKFSRIAAILFLPLFLTFAWYLYSGVHQTEKKYRIAYGEVYTPLSAKTSFVLPDSTIVWLNSGSRLKYPFSFSGKTRAVYLTGEGYFKVAKNKKVPFVVKTNKVKVTAYGTSFDVMAYPDEPNVKTTLVNGSVKVESMKDGKYLLLKPSSQVLYNVKTGTLKGYRVDTRFYTSWKDGKLIFRNEPLGTVAPKLERWFNCKIYIQDNKLKNYRYTGHIEMETLREVLELIRITTPIQYTYNWKTREIWITESK